MAGAFCVRRVQVQYFHSRHVNGVVKKMMKAGTYCDVAGWEAWSRCSTFQSEIQMSRSSVRLLILLVGFAIAAGLPDRVNAAESSGVLVLGRVSDDPKSQYEQMKALLDYVVERMGDVGIREGRILMARDSVQMASYLRRGRVDWVSETASAGMLLHQRAGADTLALSERNGIRRYHTIYFARRDSSIKSIDQLRGHRIAFQNRTSTSAYFIPAMESLELGLPMEILGSPFDAPVENSLGYVFARTERNIATWVHKGLVDVGAVSNLDWSNPQHIPELFKSDLVILRESDEVPRGANSLSMNSASHRSSMGAATCSGPRLESPFFRSMGAHRLN